MALKAKAIETKDASRSDPPISDMDGLVLNYRGGHHGLEYALGLGGASITIIPRI